MTDEEISRGAVDADLTSGRFRAGLARGQWSIVQYQFPILIASVCSDATADALLDFHFELTGFKRVAPAVHIWDTAAGGVLPAARRPQHSALLVNTFKVWGQQTVYRPWDRHALAHGEWARNYPQLAWHPDRELAFILEDLYAILSPSGDPRGARAAT